MARPIVTRWLACVLALLPAVVPAQQPAAPRTDGPASSPPLPVREPPTRPAPPQLWPVESLHGVDYISVRDIAQRFGLKVEWTRPDLNLSLSDAHGVRFTFESHQRDFHFDGLRVFLGNPVLQHADGLWIDKLDVIKIVAPLIRPADHVAYLPATAPRTIVLDPGHGGVDPGTENKRLGLNEKTFTLDVALRLKKLLEVRGWRVLLIRDKDNELSKDKKADLLMRDEFANRNKADLYLSIHFNNAIPSVTGIETYAMAPQFMLSAGFEQGDDMTRVAFPGNRQDFANLFLGEQLHRAMIAGLKTPDRGFKHARWAVLRMLECPSALVECAYLSNDAEAQRVATPDFRQRIAQALATGVQNYADALAALRPVPPPTRPALPAGAPQNLRPVTSPASPTSK